MGSKSSLNDYIVSVRERQFAWGEHDCFVFSNNAFRAYHGFGYADHWIGKYMKPDGTPLRRAELVREFGYRSIDAALDKLLLPTPQAAQMGALVTTKKYHRFITGVALGISLGSRCIFLGKNGILKINVEDTDKAWVPNGKE